MSAPSCVCFYGVRRSVTGLEIEPLETRTHPLIKASRDAGLQHYWGNFGAPGSRYYLFVGTRLGLLGEENTLEVQMGDQELASRIQTTKEKLKQAGIEDAPSLYIQWMPDA